jgi:alpha-1,2-mannosyltransferase
VAWSAAIAAAVAFAFTRRVPNDFRVYLGGARTLLEGGPLYDLVVNGWGFTYPSFAGLLFMPLLTLPLRLAFLAWQTVGVASLIALSWTIAKCLPHLAGRSRPDTAVTWALTMGVFAASLTFEAVTENFEYAQINILLAALVLMDTALLTRAQGLLTGLSAGIKVTPGLFMVFMVTTGRWRALAWAAGALAVTLLVGMAFGPGQVLRYWTHELFQTGRVGDTARVSNGSLRGVVERTVAGDLATPVWIGCVLVALFVGLWIATRWWPRDRMAAASAVGVTGLLISPMSWPHHWIWVVPLAATLGALALRAHDLREPGRAAWLLIATVCVSLPHVVHVRRWIYPLMPPESLGQVALSLAYPSSAVIGLLALALAARSFPADTPGGDSALTGAASSRSSTTPTGSAEDA